MYLFDARQQRRQLSRRLRGRILCFKHVFLQAGSPGYEGRFDDYYRQVTLDDSGSAVVHDECGFQVPSALRALLGKTDLDGYRAVLFPRVSDVSPAHDGGSRTGRWAPMWFDDSPSDQQVSIDTFDQMKEWFAAYPNGPERLASRTVKLVTRPTALAR